MDSKKLNTIISEEIDKVLNEELIQEKVGISDIASMIKNFLHGKKKHAEKPKKKYKIVSLGDKK